MNSVRKALLVLEAVADHQPVGVSELASQLGQPKSSVQRALETLHGAGWIRPSSGERTRWELTFRASRLARKAGSHFGLREAVLPHMEELRRQTSETVHLAVFDDSEIVLIERLESPHAVRHVEPLGGRASMLVTATGKAILARLSTEEVDAIHAATVERNDPGTPVPQRDALELELEEVRRLGYATTSSWRDGVFATGVAIIGPSGGPIAALSISTPETRSDEENRRTQAQLLLDHGRQINERLG
ncbi:IclR family transcriptional regulator [Nitratireductor pacificus]|uniref:Transcriptional regulator n=1 Tax=Nitratireductor pacificus pht-3B TaxID=391937 RepID=K2LLD3_9HYPH|nr:IclR family transcriptional regulator [Nitratireductor pacificus]EKF18584.1 transcriptional regulator [Nitratireductor pacificus pht-3B]